MRRFLIDHMTGNERTLELSGREAAHLTRVLRMGRGDRCVVMDRSGARALCEIRDAAGGKVLLDVVGRLPAPPAPPVEIVLCQAVLKNPAMGLVVEKASELGVSLLRPFLCSRTVVKPDETRAAGRIRRWNEIAGSAAKQSDRGAPMRIEPIRAFTEMLETLGCGENSLNLILWEQEMDKSIGAAIDRSKRITSAAAIVGPEGGFTSGEISSARAAGVLPVGLGPRVLRAETAAITVAALLQYEFGGLETV